MKCSKCNREEKLIPESSLCTHCFFQENMSIKRRISK
jgi:hypothetical protein